MVMSGRFLTNALLFVIVLLLAANLYLTAQEGGEPAPAVAGASDEALLTEPPAGGPLDHLLSARLNANETATIATLRNISSAQAQYQAAAFRDHDHDGTGEFGSFRELAGVVPAREGGLPLNPPALSGAFRTVNENGAVERSGYRFLIYLPDAEGKGVVADGAAIAGIDAQKSEGSYCVYAWPVRQGHSGDRTFLLNQTGDVFTTETEDYTGSRAPKPGAGFRDRGIESILGDPAIGEDGQDGHQWRQVN